MPATNQAALLVNRAVSAAKPRQLQGPGNLERFERLEIHLGPQFCQMDSWVLQQVACAGADVSSMALSLAYLMPGLNVWNGWSCLNISLLCMQLLPSVSLGFLTAWWSQSSEASFMAADFYWRKPCEILGVFCILVCLFVFMNISFLYKHIYYGLLWWLRW